MSSTFSFLHKPSEELKSASKQKRKRACHFPLLQKLKSSANFQRTEDLATHNNTFAKWRVSRIQYGFAVYGRSCEKNESRKLSKGLQLGDPGGS